MLDRIGAQARTAGAKSQMKVFPVVELLSEKPGCAFGNYLSVQR